MLNILKLLLPAIIPSWRFFDQITASPRIEFSLLATPTDIATQWQEFRPRPLHLSVGRTLGHLFWSARWNESLFLVSCAERLMNNPTQHSVQEIGNRIRAEFKRDSVTLPHFQFRLVFVERDVRQVTFISSVMAV